MKKAALTLILSAVMGTMSFAQIPPDWDMVQPEDTGTVKYSMGVSESSYIEQEAYKSAWNNALQNFASSIGTHIQSERNVTTRSEGYDSGVEDGYSISVETASFSTYVRLSGVREAARKTERQGGRYIVRVLVFMSMADYQKALRYIENEEAAFLAYRFFADRNRGLNQNVINRKPAGSPDYYTWLRNTCVSISFAGAENGTYLEQADMFCKKLYKNIQIFSTVIEGQNARIMYDSVRYYDGILRALQNLNLFLIAREEGRLVLTPLRSGALGDFKTAVVNMKDSTKIFVTGIEVIQTQERRVVNTGNVVINQFKTIAGRQYGLQAVNFNLPGRFTSGDYPDEEGIIGYIRENITSFPARYVAVCYAETSLEPGMTAYKLPPLITAEGRFTLYDVVTGEVLPSGMVDTRGFVFSPGNLQEQTVINEGRRALQFLYDKKNQQGFVGIMEEVLGKL